MDIEQIKQAKAEFEEDLANRIAQFEEATGTLLWSISVGHANTWSNGTLFTLSGVKIEVRLAAI